MNSIDKTRNSHNISSLQATSTLSEKQVNIVPLTTKADDLI